MKFISWNVNGLRACMQKGFLDFFQEIDADIFCLQETKLQEGQIDLNLPGYHQYWNYAGEKGLFRYRHFTKEEPLQVTYGIGVEEHDHEGRVITAEYPEFYFVTVYVPNAQQELKRLDYRMQWEADFLAYLKKLEEKKPVIYAGDLNVAHEEIESEKSEDQSWECRFYGRREKLFFQSTGKWIYRHFPLFLSGADRNLFLVVLQIPGEGEKCRMEN